MLRVDELDFPPATVASQAVPCAQTFSFSYTHGRRISCTFDVKRIVLTAISVKVRRLGKGLLPI